MSLITGIIGGIQGSSANHNAAGAISGGYAAATPLLQDATNQANAGVTGAAGAAGAGVTGAGAAANALLDPYAQSGQQANSSLSAFMAPGGQGTHQFTAADMEANDPGYQFRLQQGQLALDRSASARGAVMGGGQMKAMADYSQGLASSEYQNAFNRFTTNTQNTYSNLSGMANRGMAAANQQGENTLGAAQFAGSAGMHGADEAAQNTIGMGRFAAGAKIGSAEAQAGGMLGAANQWNHMLGSIGGAADMFLTGGLSGFAGGGGTGGGSDPLGLMGGTPQGSGTWNSSNAWRSLFGGGN